MTMLQRNPRLLARPKRIAVHGPRRLRAFGRVCRFRRWRGSRGGALAAVGEPRCSVCRFSDIALGRCLIRRHLLELSRRFRRRQLLGLRQRISRPDRRRGIRLAGFGGPCRIGWSRNCDGYRCRITRRRAARRRRVDGRLCFDHCGGHRGESRHRRQIDDDALDQTTDDIEDRTRGTCQNDEQDYRAEQQGHTDDRTNDRIAEQRLQDRPQDGGSGRRRQSGGSV